MVRNNQLDIAIAHKVEGKYDEALLELKAVLSEEPDMSEAHHQMGLVLGFIGEFDESLSELMKAVSLDGHNLTIRNDLALTYAMLGMNDEAKAEFETVLQMDPGNEVAQKNIIFF